MAEVGGARKEKGDTQAMNLIVRMSVFKLMSMKRQTRLRKNEEKPELFSKILTLAWVNLKIW